MSTHRMGKSVTPEVDRTVVADEIVTVIPTISSGDSCRDALAIDELVPGSGEDNNKASSEDAVNAIKRRIIKQTLADQNSPRTESAQGDWQRLSQSLPIKRALLAFAPTV